MGQLAVVIWSLGLSTVLLFSRSSLFPSHAPSNWEINPTPNHLSISPLGDRLECMFFCFPNALMKWCSRAFPTPVREEARNTSHPEKAFPFETLLVAWVLLILLKLFKLFVPLCVCTCTCMFTCILLHVYYGMPGEVMLCVFHRKSYNWTSFVSVPCLQRSNGMRVKPWPLEQVLRNGRIKAICENQ